MRTTPSSRALLCLAVLVIAGLIAGLWAFVAIEDRLRPEIVVVRADKPESISAGITGAVERPGVYDLPIGSRVADLLEAAGGPVSGADISALNQAARLDDLAMVDVPFAVAQATPSFAESNPQMGIVATDPRLDLNVATLEQLDGLPGIGPVLAEAIIAERERLGGFDSIDQLVSIAGISERMVEELRPLIRVTA